MQFAAVAQDTAVSAEYPMWPMSGVRWTVHLAPFQRSASVRAPLAEDPTATQTVGEGQDTPLNSLEWVGLGAGMSCHRDPFHRSASTVSRKDGDGMARAPRLASPTAMQNRAVAHETAARVRVCGTGAGLGTRSACHVRPFQRAAIGRARAGPEPAAWQRTATGQETLPSGPADGRGTIDQRVPVHASAGVPTARQDVAVAQDTPSNWL